MISFRVRFFARHSCLFRAKPGLSAFALDQITEKVAIERFCAGRSDLDTVCTTRDGLANAQHSATLAAGPHTGPTCS